MSPITRQVSSLFDTLTEREQALVYELILRLAPDDIATREDIADIIAAREEFRQGETVGIDAIDWN